MRKYNAEILTSLVNQAWNTDGIAIRVNDSTPRRFGYSVFSARTVHKKREGFIYEEFVAPAIQAIKEQINKNARGSESVTLVPFPDGQLLKARFEPDQKGKFWGDVGVVIQCLGYYETPEYIADDYPEQRLDELLESWDRYFEGHPELPAAEPEEAEEIAAELLPDLQGEEEIEAIVANGEAPAG